MKLKLAKDGLHDFGIIQIHTLPELISGRSNFKNFCNSDVSVKNILEIISY